MNELTKIDENKLAAALKEWFNNIDTYKDHFWTRNKVAVLLKNQLKLIGRWKNRRRGNPSKGYAMRNRNFQ